MPGNGAGLEGVVASPSAISFVDGQAGKLLYRGYNIKDLAARSSFEEVCWLLWHGELPAAKELEELRALLGREAALPAPVLDVLRTVARVPGVHPMDALRTAVSAMGCLEQAPAQPGREHNLATAVRLVARTPTIVGAFHQLRQGREPLAPQQGKGIAHNLLRGITGEEPGPAAVRALDVALVLHADHEFNASTFTARVVASTLADMTAAAAAALAALKGPLHGGANVAVMEALRHVGGPDKVEAWVDEQLGQRKRVFGFGHRVYKTMDPRASVLRELSHEVGEEKGDLAWYETSARMQEAMMARKGLWPNVDFYSASLYHVMGIPDDLYTLLFATSRMSGWTAHLLEQYADNRLIRPRADYTGPAERPYPADRPA